MDNRSSIYYENLKIDHVDSEFFVYESGIRIKNYKNEINYLWDDILGATVTSADSISLNSYQKSNKNSKRTLKKQSLQTKNPEVLEKIIQSMSNRLGFPNLSSPPYRKRFLILINPASGRKKSLKVWKQVSELFEVCEIQIILTEYRNHATEIILKINPSQYDGIIVVSGDGLVHEVFNALCINEDERVRRIPVGVIPAGSGNALAKNVCFDINEDPSAENCAYVCIKGVSSMIDISKVVCESGKTIYSFLCILWAFLADVDIESEVARCCGRFRFDVYGFYRLLFLRTYRAHLKWSKEASGVYSGEISYFVASNLPFIGTTLKVAPSAVQNDGMNDLIFVRNEGRIRFTRVLLSQNDGQHTHLPYVRSHKSNYWELAPNQGIFSIDGELYQAEAIKVRVLKGFANILKIEL